MSQPGGAGIGTLGFTIPRARQLIVEDGGFTSFEVILEEDGARWFKIQ